MKIFLIFIFFLNINFTFAETNKGDLDQYVLEDKNTSEDIKYISSDKFNLQAFLDEMN